jgi:hypothetical protein
MSLLAFLHTSPENRRLVTGRLRRSPVPGLVIHRVEEPLLTGPWTSLDSRDDAVFAAVQRLGRLGAGRVICTCTTIGASAEAAGARCGIPTTRIDRPLMRAAARRGNDVAVVIAAATTRSSTLALIHEERVHAGRTGRVTPIDIPGAWTNFMAGRHALYLEQVATAARDALVDHDVVVLAQLSMAPAAEGLGPNVLTSLEFMMADVNEFADSDPVFRAH